MARPLVFPSSLLLLRREGILYTLTPYLDGQSTHSNPTTLYPTTYYGRQSNEKTPTRRSRGLRPIAIRPPLLVSAVLCLIAESLLGVGQ